MKMASTRKYLTSHLNVFEVFFACIRLCVVFGEISSPSKVIGIAGLDVTFQFNTTRENSIKGVKFGLDGNESYPIPKFITVLNMEREQKVIYGDDLDGAASSYKERVSFTGDLEKGHAWFRLSNLFVNDTNLYMSSIREDSDEDYKQKNTVKLAVIKTVTTPPTHATEARFTDFDGIAMKNCKSYRIAGKENFSTVYDPIWKAYLNIYINHEIKINYVRKRNKTVTAGFHIRFSKAMNKTYAFSFLERAQRNNHLRGYNITCFEKLDDVKRKPDKSSLSPYLVVFFVIIIAVVVVLLTILAVYCKLYQTLTSIIEQIVFG